MNRLNVRDLIEANGLRILVDMLTLAHLHINRAVVPLQVGVSAVVVVWSVNFSGLAVLRVFTIAML